MVSFYSFDSDDGDDDDDVIESLTFKQFKFACISVKLIVVHYPRPDFAFGCQRWAIIVFHTN